MVLFDAYVSGFSLSVDFHEYFICLLIFTAVIAAREVAPYHLKGRDQDGAGQGCTRV